jgi:predicted nucleotidyltransferase
MMERKTLKKELVKIVNICKEFGANKVLLFGSCISDINSARDIDIAVSGVKDRDFFKFYGKISMMVGDEVDLIDLDDIREHLRNRIMSKGKLIYERSK